MTAALFRLALPTAEAAQVTAGRLTQDRLSSVLLARNLTVRPPPRARSPRPAARGLDRLSQPFLCTLHLKMHAASQESLFSEG